ncbi:uncharacterized protein LOC121744576 isoform X3 [Salvia splendens]|uniref:uncharacterized protein LOC121744576 isoform X3 n=1 Tax=Salvia splendens TaxID=180675 RepID=UPI001C27F5E0|nr:uncharacterized protein LOC121744576 isoform X3 [Salvia splendens]
MMVGAIAPILILRDSVLLCWQDFSEGLSKHYSLNLNNSNNTNNHGLSKILGRAKTRIKPYHRTLSPAPHNCVMASFAARSVLRSAARISVGVKPRASPSPFRLPSQNPLSARIFRSPVEMSSVTVASMLPCHTATASALLTSMLSVAPRTHAWTIEGL